MTASEGMKRFIEYNMERIGLGKYKDSCIGDDGTIVQVSEIRKNRPYWYSWADNLSRRQIILLGDNIMKKSPDFINDVLKFKNLEEMKTIEITKTYEVFNVKELVKGNKIEVALEEPYGKQIGDVVNVDKLGGIVVQTFRKTPLYLKEKYVVRELGTENYKLLSDDEANDLLK